MKSTTSTGKVVEGIKVLGSLAFILLLLIVIVAWAASQSSNGDNQDSSNNPSISTQQYGTSPYNPNANQESIRLKQASDRLDQLWQQQAQDTSNQHAQSQMNCIQSSQQNSTGGYSSTINCYE